MKLKDLSKDQLIHIITKMARDMVKMEMRHQRVKVAWVSSDDITKAQNELIERTYLPNDAETK